MFVYVLIVAASSLNLISPTNKTCITSGIVQECTYGILPNIPSALTLCLALASFLVSKTYL